MGTLLKKVLQKQAGAAGDFWRPVLGRVPASALTMVNPPLGLALSYGQGVAALAGKKIGDLEGFSRDKEELIDLLRKYEDDKYLSYVPGVGSYRLGARTAILNKLLEDKTNKDRSTGTSREIHKASLINPLNWVGLPFALIGAAVTKTKKLNEVADIVNDKNYGLKSWLIPGWKVYQDLKALGASDKISQMDYTEDEVDAIKNNDETKQLLKKKLQEYRQAQARGGK